jgi:hypothetical protein
MRKWVFLIILLAIIGGALYYMTFGYYSDGTRVGSLIKLSRKGYVFKTYEGQLQVGGMSDGTGSMMASNWDFSVDEDNDAAIDALNLASKMGQRVVLHYEEKFFQLPWNGDTKYFITSVERVPVVNVVQPVAAPPAVATPTPIDTTKAQ